MDYRTHGNTFLMKDETTSLGLRAIAVFTATTALVYGQTLGAGFVWDDVFLIERNPSLNEFSSMWMVAWGDFFQQGHTTRSGYLRPVPTILNWLTISIFGRSAPVFHLTNLLLHFATILLAGRVLLRIGLTPVATTVALMIFTLHPMQVEAISFVSCRPELCAGLSIFAVLVCYDRYRHTRQWRWLALSCLAFCLGLLSKEIVLGVIPVVIWFEATQFSKRVWRGVGVLVLTGTVIFGLRLLWGPSLSNGLLADAPRLVVALNLLGFYVGQLFLLEGPRCLYTYLEVTGFGLYFGLGLMACLVLLLPVVRRDMRSPIYFGVLWFSVFIAPALHFIPFGTLAADRYLYVPMWGVALICGVLTDRARASGMLMGRVASVVLCTTLVALVLLSIQRTYQWRNEVTLWSAEVSQLPVQGHALTEFGTALAEAGRLAEAHGVYRAAWRLKPGSPILFRNLARLESQQLPHATRQAFLSSVLRKDVQIHDLEAWVTPLERVNASELVALIRSRIRSQTPKEFQESN
jgi:hypothetical protein